MIGDEQSGAAATGRLASQWLTGGPTRTDPAQLQAWFDAAAADRIARVSSYTVVDGLPNARPSSSRRFNWAAARCSATSTLFINSAQFGNFLPLG